MFGFLVYMTSDYLEFTYLQSDFLTKYGKSFNQCILSN